MRIALVILAIAALVAACQRIRPTAPIQPSANSVIFPAERTEAERAHLAPVSEGAWTPTADDIASLEEALIPFLRQAEHPWLRPDPPIWERVPDYHRQYLGLIVAGERVVHANFFCRADDPPWTTAYVEILDGGDCYFRVTYNPATGEFTHFDVNGES